MIQHRITAVSYARGMMQSVAASYQVLAESDRATALGQMVDRMGENEEVDDPKSPQARQKGKV